MSIKALLSQLWLEKESLAYRAPQVYNIAANNLFNITGPVLIYLLGGRATAAAGGAATMAVTVNGVATQAGAVAINGAVGTIWCVPLNVAGVIAAAAGAIPLTTALLHPPQGMLSGIQVAAVGVIVGTVAVATWTGDIFCLYRKLSPNASINVA